MRLRTFGADTAKITRAGEPAGPDQVIFVVGGAVSRRSGRPVVARFMTITKTRQERIFPRTAWG
ncbi:hypothetical protein JCM9533A_33920 [Catenuloplanes niger JCM 9533]